MASREIKDKILKHLSAKSDTWASTVSKVSADVGSQFFTEQAMKELSEEGEIEPDPTSVATMPKYQAPGATEGKYAGFNDKRLDKGPYSYQPEREPLGYKKSV